MRAVNAAPATASLIKLEGITKRYEIGEVETWALAGVDLTIEDGEFVALTGPSGSGKTTLMHLIGLLDQPTAGQYHLRGEDVTGLTENELAEARNREIGFVFQAFHLLPRLSALENVEVPLTYAGVPAHQKRERALQMLERVGLADKARNQPNQMSGGQKQRVAIARALAINPSLLLADEPTGNLDSRTSEDVMRVFTELNGEGVTVVMVTHEADIAAHAKRVVRLRDGLIESDQRQVPHVPEHLYQGVKP